MQVKEVIKTWDYGEGHDEKSHVTGDIFGTIVGLTIPISSVTGGATVKVTFRDADECVIIPDAAFATLANGTKHIFYFLSEQETQNATENPVAVMGKVTVAIDPSADPSATGETLTVKVRIFYRED